MGVVFQKCDNALTVGIIAAHPPVLGRRDQADDKPAVIGLEVGRGRRHPEIHADRAVIGMSVDRPKRA